MVQFHNKIFKHKYYLDLFNKILIFCAALAAIIISFFIIVFISYQSIPVFRKYGFWNFIFSKAWLADTLQFGAMSFVISTLLVVFLAMLIAIPLAIFTSVLISEFLGKKIKRIVIFLVELLAGVPPVIFGIFGLEVIGSFYKQIGASSPANMLTAATILALMALPTIIALICNALNSVPSSYRFASLAMGVSRTSSAFKVVKKAVRTKIIGAITFGICRVICEVTAMIMVSGLVYQIPTFQNGFLGFIFSGITSLAAVIGIELAESASTIHTSALFALGLVLIIFVSILNIVILATYKVANNQIQGVSYTKKLKIYFITKVLRRNMTVLEDHQISNQRLLSYYDESKILKFHRQFNKLKDVIWILLMFLSTIITLSMVIWIIGDVIIKGIQSTVFLTPYREVLQGSYDLTPLFVSTLLLIVCSLVVSIPLGILGGIYLNEYANKTSKIANLIRFSVDALVATPSVVFGMFGYIVFVNILGIGHNFISAGLMFGVLTLPIIIKTTEDALNGVAQEYRDSSLALGVTKIGTIFKIILPNCKKGIVTGIVFAISKVISESMPALLTLSSSPFMPQSLLDPGTTLTVKIYQLINEPDIVAGPAHLIKISAYQLAKIIAYEIAAITILLIIVLNLLVKYITREKKNFGYSYNNLKGVMLWLKRKRTSIEYKK